jgi:hypothetical protein
LKLNLVQANPWPLLCCDPRLTDAVGLGRCGSNRDSGVRATLRGVGAPAGHLELLSEPLSLFGGIGSGVRE